MKITILIIFLIFYNHVLAQLPHSFTPVARNLHHGLAWDVAVDSSGNIFLANGYAGLMAFEFNNNSLTNKANARLGGTFDPILNTGVAVGDDGTVFLTDGDNGLWAYSFTGTSLVNIAHINYTGFSGDVFISPEGIVFTTRFHGFSAYEYTGTSFNLLYHINDNNITLHSLSFDSQGHLFVCNSWEGFRIYDYNYNSIQLVTTFDDIGRFDDLAIRADSTVFIAKYSDGLWAYHFDGTSFTYLAHADDGRSNFVKLGSDGTIFSLGNDLHAYTFEDSIFVNNATVEIPWHGVQKGGLQLWADSIVIVADGKSGLRFFEYNNSILNEIIHYENGSAECVAEGDDGKLFLLNDDDGMWIYSLDDSIFNIEQHLVDSTINYAADAVVDEHGTLFLANNNDLRAYKHNGISYIMTAQTVLDSGRVNSLALSPNGNLFVTGIGPDFQHRNVTEGGLYAFSYDGTTFSKIAHIDDEGNATDVAVGADGTVFLANGDLGLWAYSFDGTQFLNVAQIDSGYATQVAVSPDGYIFTLGFASGMTWYLDEGLRVYTYNGTSFTNVAHIEEEGIRSVSAGPDGTIFMNNHQGLTAYTFDGSVFTKTAENFDFDAGKLTVGSNGIVYLASGIEGLIAYEYSGFPTSLKEQKPEIPQNYFPSQNYPNPFNPTTNIEFSIPKSEKVKIEIFNLLGQKVQTLINKYMPTGSYKVEFNAHDLPSGIYLYRFEVGNYHKVKKMVLLK